jgi:tetratricopeptide (TPR) repeat protein
MADETAKTPVIQLNATQFQGATALAYNLYEQGKMREAETLFAGLSVMNPQSYYGFAGLGAVALAKRPPDLDSAYKSLSEAAQLNPNDTSVQANLGETLLRQGKVDEAKTHLEKCFALDPGHNDPGANRARAIVGGLNMIAQQLESRLQAQSKPAAKAS